MTNWNLLRAAFLDETDALVGNLLRRADGDALADLVGYAFRLALRHPASAANLSLNLPGAADLLADSTRSTLNLAGAAFARYVSAATVAVVDVTSRSAVGLVDDFARNGFLDCLPFVDRFRDGFRFLNRTAFDTSDLAVLRFSFRAVGGAVHRAILGFADRTADRVVDGLVRGAEDRLADRVADIFVFGAVNRLANIARHCLVVRGESRAANVLLDFPVVGRVDRPLAGVGFVAIVSFANGAPCRDRNGLDDALHNCLIDGVLLWLVNSFCDSAVALTT